MDSRLLWLLDADVYAPEPRGRSDVLVGGGKVLAMLPAGGARGLSDVPGTERVDLHGLRLIPGLIDAHVHLTGGGGESGPASRVPRVPLSSLTKGGVTTVVGLLGTDGTTRSVSSLVASALALREEGLSAYCWTGSYEVPPITLTGSVRGDIVFVDPILGVGEVAVSDHRSSQPSFEEIARLAADCHVAGMMSGKAGVLHLHLGDGPRGLDLVRRCLRETELPAGVFHPTHVNRKTRLFAEAVELAREGVTIDVTAFPVDEGEDAHSAPDAVALYLESGAPRDRLTMSSDGGGCLPTFDASGRIASMGIGDPSAVAAALRTLLERGFGLADVLPVVTSNVASLLRLPNKGRIAVGADADFVVLDAEHRVHDVVAAGRFMVREKQTLVRGTFEGAR